MGTSFGDLWIITVRNDVWSGTSKIASDMIHVMNSVMISGRICEFSQVSYIAKIPELLPGPPMPPEVPPMLPQVPPMPHGPPIPPEVLPGPPMLPEVPPMQGQHGRHWQHRQHERHWQHGRHWRHWQNRAAWAALSGGIGGISRILANTPKSNEAESWACITLLSFSWNSWKMQLHSRFPQAYQTPGNYTFWDMNDQHGIIVQSNFWYSYSLTRKIFLRV